jgi:wyosine [tRNA(Phe)-imidazoG37] synthetase (radical SAM superfamily)
MDPHKEELEMGYFTWKPVYEERGQRVLEINVLPEKYCNFDCIFCPIGRSRHAVEPPSVFAGTEQSLQELNQKIEEEKPDLVFINSKGESFANEALADIIDAIHVQGIGVRLLTNGYLLGDKRCRELANRCEEVLGEIKTVTEGDFQKVQRPHTGYTLSMYIQHMADFTAQYKGKFLFEVTIIKGYNDSDQGIAALQTIIGRIHPDVLHVVTIDDPRFAARLGVDEVTLQAIAAQLR